jgi:sulfatase maturation enzyme AslB (radical SAM superfamily)
LAKSLANHDHDVWFALDGLEGVHEIYRQGTSFKKTIANAESFIQHGGYATWQFIPWAHNEHQLRKCMQLSSAMGFKKFKLVRSVSEKFIGKHYQTGEIINFQPWSQSNSTNPLNQRKDNVILTTSDCRHLVDKMIYLNANGHLSPCCYLNHRRQFHDNEFPDLTKEIQQNPDPFCLSQCGNGVIIKAHQ